MYGGIAEKNRCDSHHRREQLFVISPANES
jgi:hypothetical protein